MPAKSREKKKRAPKRRATILRKTKETDIRVELYLDGTGKSRIATPIPFLDHMLTLMAVHGLLDLEIQARGDTQIDFHHTVEDIGICLGKAFQEALGDKKALYRYGSAFSPMDESLAEVHVDLSGRPRLVYLLPFSRRKIGNFDTELIHEFLQALVSHGAMTLHARVVYGKNGHHMVEALFKALGRALRQAFTLDPRRRGIPSSKGKL